MIRMAPKFATEKTLGKLTKWLRVLGFDTYEVTTEIWCKETGIEDDRFRLTRTRKHFEQLKEKHGLFIKSNEPVQQLKEVILALGITEKDIKPFSRCIVCNTLIEPIAKEVIQDVIPDYVWENFDNFQKCQKCNKIYWSGSHIERGKKRIKALFENN